MVIGNSVGYPTSCRCYARRRVVSTLQERSAVPQPSDWPANTHVAPYVPSLSRWPHTSSMSALNSSTEHNYIACAVAQIYLIASPFLRSKMRGQRLIYTAQLRQSGSRRSHWETGRLVFLPALSRGATYDSTFRKSCFS